MRKAPAARRSSNANSYFTAHGITRIQRLITDNAWAYRYSLREVCATHGITQKFVKPHCPWQNGKVERLNRTLASEWAYRQVFTSNTERAAALAPWLEHDNAERRHSALGGKPPISRMPSTYGRVHLEAREQVVAAGGRRGRADSNIAARQSPRNTTRY